MRIFGKVCSWILAAILALQATGLFCGASLNGPIFAAEIAVLAIIMVENAIFDFKKPKHPFFRWRIVYANGGEEEFIWDAFRPLTISKAHLISEIDATYFESGKGEANVTALAGKGKQNNE